MHQALGSIPPGLPQQLRRKDLLGQGVASHRGTEPKAKPPQIVREAPHFPYTWSHLGSLVKMQVLILQVWAVA